MPWILDFAAASEWAIAKEDALRFMESRRIILAAPLIAGLAALVGITMALARGISNPLRYSARIRGPGLSSSIFSPRDPSFA